MKQFLKSMLALTLITGFAITAYAQDNNSIPLALAKINPYQMEVTYDKTSHLIFPSAIRYVDLGSSYLIAGKAEDAGNVLRIKAAVRDFVPETNFSVITDDGCFYNFNVLYDSCPNTLNYDLLKMQKSTQKENASEVLFEELGGSTPTLTGLLLETIYKKDKRIIKHIGSKSFGIEFLLKGIYIHNGKYYFHTQLRNGSNVPFQIDFVNFKVVDKKTAKRTVSQERLLKPLRMYKPLDSIIENTKEQNVFLMDQFTIADDKVLQIEIFEQNGGRHQVLQVENSDLINAKPVNTMLLKI
jgi:conjugative transposon TraN protein